jgi:DtxR family Mn-dependent transcriptional regulator
LKYLDKHQIGIGTDILVNDKEDFDQSMTITIRDKTVLMSKAITTNIYVKLKNS